MLQKDEKEREDKSCQNIARLSWKKRKEKKDNKRVKSGLIQGKLKKYSD